MQALHNASAEVIATQCQQLNIQRRFQADMHDLWMLQVRLERRTGKNPYTLIAHPRYRAAYDFMLLRSLLGHVPDTQVRWWDEFVAADDVRRSEMIDIAQHEARQTGERARSRRKRSNVGGETRMKSSRGRRHSHRQSGSKEKRVE